MQRYTVDQSHKKALDNLVKVRNDVVAHTDLVSSPLRGHCYDNLVETGAQRIRDYLRAQGAGPQTLASVHDRAPGELKNGFRKVCVENERKRLERKGKEKGKRKGKGKGKERKKERLP